MFDGCEVSKEIQASYALLLERYVWFDSFSLSKLGAVKEYKQEWDAFRFLVGGKMFMMFAQDKNKIPIVTLKLEPLRGELERAQYPCIVPGYYMNKTHWNSIYIEGTLTDDVFKDMIDESYRLIFASLPKKQQNVIRNLQ